MADYQNRYYSGGGVNASMRYATPKATFDLMYGLNNRPHVQHYRLYSLHRLHDERHDIRQEEHIVGKAWAHDLRASFNYRWKEHWDMDFTYTGMFSPDKKSSSRSEGGFQQSLNERGLTPVCITLPGVYGWDRASHSGQTIHAFIPTTTSICPPLSMTGRPSGP